MTRVAVLIVALFFYSTVFGQGERFKPSFNSPFSIPKEFLRTQWFLGFKFGGNLSPVSSKTSFNGFSPINYDAEELEKDYSAEWGGHAGIDITFYGKGFSVSVQPNFRRQAYSYKTSFIWGDPTTQSFNSNQTVEQRMDLLDFPFLVKYDVTRSLLRPFITAGIYYSVLTAAEKNVKITSTDSRVDPPVRLSSQSLSIGNKGAFQDNTTGYILGGGFSWDPGNVRVVLDFLYRDSFSSITTDDSRFSENQLAGIGDIDDEISLRNLNISFSFLFPLRFISQDFTSTY